MYQKFNYYSVVDGYYSFWAEIDDNIADDIIATIEEFDRRERNYQRKMRYHGVLSLDGEAYEDVISGDDPVSFLLERMETEKILRAMEKLPPVKRWRLVMRMQGMTYEQIAQIENISVAAAWESIHSAQRIIRTFLTED